MENNDLGEFCDCFARIMADLKAWTFEIDSICAVEDFVLNCIPFNSA